MDADQKILERIAVALERIANALEKNSPVTAHAFKEALKSVPEKVKNIPAKKVQEALPTQQESEPPTPESVVKTTPTTLSKSAKKKMAELRKTPAGQQLCNFFETLGLTILNPGAIAPKVEHQKLANAIWQFRSVGFDLMININSAMHRKSTYTLDLSEKTKAEKSCITSLCDAAKKAKLISYDQHDNSLEVSPLDDKTNYISGKWGEDVILTKTLKIAEFINKQKDKPICFVFKNIEYKKSGSDRWMDSECDVVLAVNGMFYFIEVKTGKQLNVVNYVTQVEHLNSKKEFSIFCCIDANSAPDELQPLREKSNFAVFDFEHFEESLKELIKKRQNYSFDKPPATPPN